MLSLGVVGCILASTFEGVAALAEGKGKGIPAWTSVVREEGVEIGTYIDQRRSTETIFTGTDDYLVIPRSVLQSMPKFWQIWLVKLLRHCDRSVAWLPGCGYRVERLNYEGFKGGDPYREWKAPNGRVRRILSWDEVKSARMVDGEVQLRADERKAVKVWTSPKMDPQAVYLDPPPRSISELIERGREASPPHTCDCCRDTGRYPLPDGQTVPCPACDTTAEKIASLESQLAALSSILSKNLTDSNPNGIAE